jgi:hypothetical protein
MSKVGKVNEILPRTGKIYEVTNEFFYKGRAPRALNIFDGKS